VPGSTSSVTRATWRYLGQRAALHHARHPVGEAEGRRERRLVDLRARGGPRQRRLQARHPVAADEERGADGDGEDREPEGDGDAVPELQVDALDAGIQCHCGPLHQGVGQRRHGSEEALWRS
jgi:hypothetical protein